MQTMVFQDEDRMGDPSAFATARRAVSTDDLVHALPLLERLSNAEPDNAELRLYTVWTRHRLDEAADATRLAEIEVLARAVLASRASLALPLCILAHCAARRRELLVARTLFRHAAMADPSLVDARRGLRAVDHALAQPPASRAALVATTIGMALVLTLLFLLRFA